MCKHSRSCSPPNNPRFLGWASCRAVATLRVDQVSERTPNVTRKTIDCRDFPGPCTLAISGEESEVLTAQAAHLASVHDMADTTEVRTYVRSMLKDDPSAMTAASGRGERS